MNLVFARAVVRSPGAGEWDRAPLAPVAAYSAGTVAGGTVMGLLLAAIGSALVGSLPSAAVVAAVALITAVAVFLQLRGSLGPLPQRHAQLPSRWMRWRSRTRLGVAFGLVLGAGVFTYLHHATAYVLGALLVISASPQVGAIAGATYGLSRAAMLVLAWAHRDWTGRGDVVVTAIGKAATRSLPVAAAGSAVIAVAAINTAPWGA